MRRLDAMQAIYPELERSIVVTIMGAVAAELQSLGHRPNFFYLQHAMGLASSVGLGIALSRPELPVVVLDGDGSLLMNLGSLCTIAAEAPKNYVLMVWDNEVHQTTGGQATATARKASLVGIARGAGVEKGIEVRIQEELERAVDRILKEEGPFIVVVKIDKGPSAAPFDQDLIGQASRFRKALAALPAA